MSLPRMLPLVQNSSKANWVKSQHKHLIPSADNSSTPEKQVLINTEAIQHQFYILLSVWHSLDLIHETHFDTACLFCQIVFKITVSKPITASSLPRNCNRDRMPKLVPWESNLCWRCKRMPRGIPTFSAKEIGQIKVAENADKGTRIGCIKKNRYVQNANLGLWNRLKCISQKN